MSARKDNLLGLLGLLGEEYGLDVRQYTTLSDGHTGEELVQFLVVADGQLKMTGNDPRLLVVTGSVASESYFLNLYFLRYQKNFLRIKGPIKGTQGFFAQAAGLWGRVLVIRSLVQVTCSMFLCGVRY